MSKTTPKKTQAPRPKLAKPDAAPPDPDDIRDAAETAVSQWWATSLSAIDTIHADMERLAAELKRPGSPLVHIFDRERFGHVLVEVQGALNAMIDTPPYLADIPNPLAWRAEGWTATAAAG